jgi:hypoxanthine phosphoribosyltransferase
MTPEESWKILESADLLCDETQVRGAIARLAGEITEKLRDRFPLVLAVMGGSVFFAGNLLPLLRFPLEFDYVQASRYGKGTTAGKIVWTVEPGENVKAARFWSGRHPRRGDTLAAIRDRVKALGAAAFFSVLTDKDISRAKPAAPILSD